MPDEFQERGGIHKCPIPFYDSIGRVFFAGKLKKNGI
jgi:hypothetical protein